MDILAGFFLIGLILTGTKVLTLHIFDIVSRANNTEEILIRSSASDTDNLLADVSQHHRDADYLRVKSTNQSNDNMRALSFDDHGEKMVLREAPAA